MLPWLNSLNGADKIEAEYFTKCLTDFDGELYGAVMGIAYGGQVEEMGKVWKERGKVYGFDTFEDLHPKHLAKDPASFEATCMDYWYGEDVHGTKNLAYSYIRGELDKQGLDNVILVKGLINANSLKDVPYLNYVMLDMDIIKSMKMGYNIVKDKIVKGGYLLLHDVIPPTHLPQLNDLYLNTILEDPQNTWEIAKEQHQSFIVALRKI
uniref:Methyltransferase n=1 Tax=viral metagenome TaxID=1070528 RepID=A0A6M3KVT6_9ZZZZ